MSCDWGRRPQSNHHRWYQWAIRLVILEGSSLKALGNILLALVLMVASTAHIHAAQNVEISDHVHTSLSLDQSTPDDTHSGHGSKHCGPLLLSHPLATALHLDTTTTVWAGAALKLAVHLFVVDPPPPRKDSLAV